MPRLADEGHELRLLVRSPPKASDLSGRRVELCQGHLGSEGALREAVSGVEGVIHAAGLVMAPRRADFLRVNAEGTGRLAAAAAGTTRGAPRFLYLSSQAAVGPSASAVSRSEEDPPAPVSEYGRSKLQAEKVVGRFGEMLPWTILRPPGVYGPGDRGFLSFFRMAGRGTVFLPASPAMKLSLVHVEDLCEGIVRALGSPQAVGKTYFLTGTQAPTVAELVSLMGEAFDRRVRIVRVPSSLARALALGFDLWNGLRGKGAFFSRDKLAELRGPHWLCSGERAERELGFRAKVPLREGIRETAEWYRKEGWL